MAMGSPDRAWALAKASPQARAKSARHASARACRRSPSCPGTGGRRNPCLEAGPTGERVGRALKQPLPVDYPGRVVGVGAESKVLFVHGGPGLLHLEKQ